MSTNSWTTNNLLIYLRDPMSILAIKANKSSIFNQCLKPYLLVILF
jgi:hypothetical protein